ncbi:MAG: hypothetical protein EOM91_02125 [Sphingobacteriia bacterium]|nr:hypothetical protein [Sphingobacteriia bacterium]NCC38514.1 hypothetical protein [Gammaproteobacteria bacterium]
MMIIRLSMPLLLLLIWLAGTQSGLRVLLDLSTAWIPHRVDIKAVEGRLLGRIVLHEVSIQNPRMEVRIGRILMTWAPLRLAEGRLAITELAVHDLDLILPDHSARHDSPLAQPTVHLPFALALEATRIEALRIFRGDASTSLWSADRVEITAHLLDRRIELEEFAVHLDAHSLTLAGQGWASLDERPGFELLIDAHATPTPATPLLGQARVWGDTDRLALQLAVTGAAELRMDAQIDDPLIRPRWEILTRIDRLDPSVFSDRIPGLAIRGTTRAKGHADILELDAGLLLEPTERPGLGPLIASFALRRQGESVQLRAFDLTLEATGAQLSTVARIDTPATVSRTTRPAHLQASISALRLASPAIGVWTLAAPSNARWQATALTMDPICLRHAGGSHLCVRIDRPTATGWRIGWQLDPFDLGLIAPHLPAPLRLDGRARVTGHLMTDQAHLSGDVMAHLEPGRLGIGAEHDQPLDISGTRLDLRVAKTGATAELALPLADLGRIRADLRLPGWGMTDPARPDQALEGRIQASVTHLKWLTDRVPQLSSRLRGTFDADTRIGGTLGTPTLTGEARLHAQRLAVPLLGLEVERLDLTARAPTPTRIDLTGTARIGDEHLRIEGHGVSDEAGLRARIETSGERLAVVATPELAIKVSPRLSIDLTTSGGSIHGDIAIPEASIRPLTRPEGTVRPSRDVVIKGRDRPSAYPLTIDIGLLIGEGVDIDAFGLTGRLGGTLRLTQAPGRDLLGNGRLSISDGQYLVPIGNRGLGRLLPPLDITRGELIWSGTPLRNPGVLVQAQRRNSRVSATVRILGTLDTPRFAFFSDRDPDMSESEAILFLLTGLPPSRVDDTAGIAVDLSDFITLGTFLELQTGLGDALYGLRLRHDLSERIQIEMQTGSRPSADVFWTHER